MIRNGIENGYPFVEAYASWGPACDRIVVVDGASRDGTLDALFELQELEPKLDVVSRPWPHEREAGAAIARLTDEALMLARPGAERLVYVQADEVYTPRQRMLAAAGSGIIEFESCVNFWNGFDRVLANEFPMRYVRAFPADADAGSIGDGYSFLVRGDVETVPERFLHYGWCFPASILRKHVSHATIYRDSVAYRLRGAFARLLLRQGRFDRELLDALAPQYVPVPWTGEHPDCVRHLVGLFAYDPAVGLRLLREGARW